MDVFYFISFDNMIKISFKCISIWSSNNKFIYILNLTVENAATINTEENMEISCRLLIKYCILVYIFLLIRFLELTPQLLS